MPKNSKTIDAPIKKYRIPKNIFLLAFLFNPKRLYNVISFGELGLVEEVEVNALLLPVEVALLFFHGESSRFVNSSKY